MKKFAFFSLLAVLCLPGCNQRIETSLTFTNPLDIPRENEVVQIPYEEMKTLLGNFESGKLPLFISGEDTLTCQFLNYQGDELPEELLVQISLNPSEKKKVRVIWTDRGDYPEFSAKTSIHFARHENPGKDLETETRIQTTSTEVISGIFQMEGPAWENDKVGFRNYFDHRNGMDIFGKRTKNLVLMNVGLNERTRQTGGYNFE
ncbi:MAG: DUF4861 family protein, partial [Bacteroidales bacterium]|nr:DUF4861 family protein [Bacteroidales bacterium]